MSVRIPAATWVPSTYYLNLLVELSEWSTEVIETITVAPVITPNDKESYKSSSSITVTMHAGATIHITSVGCGKLFVEGDEIGDGSLIEVCQGDRDLIKETINFNITIPSSSLISFTENTRIVFTVVFTNIIQQELRGLYQCTYKDPSNTELEKRDCRMASTHFEPMGARLCYICLDEPAARAAFRLTVRIPIKDQHLTVLSNSPEKENFPKENGSYFEHQFEEIPMCPPYLTCIVVGDLECLTETTPPRKDGSPGTPLRFFTTKGKKQKAKFSLECAKASLVFFEEFFQSKFPLPKLDLVAVPDFPIGGMENWGCITLLERCLLDEESSSVSTLKSVGNLIAHEVSHNWFGNLVGIDWWEGLWLKEGFATWYGYQGIAHFRPKLHAENDLVEEVFHALSIDTFEASHPVEVPIENPADITQIFDEISYSKGLSVVRMLSNYMGSDVFCKAIAHYIKKFSYKNTKTRELWDSMEEASNLPLVKVMESFTKQQGFPLLVVTDESPSDFGAHPTRIRISQKPFHHYKTENNAIKGQYWNVPVHIDIVDAATGDKILKQRVVLADDSMIIDIPKVPEGQRQDGKKLVLLVNAEGFGFYRTLYHGDLYSSEKSNTVGALHTSIWGCYEKLNKMERHSLSSDAWALYYAGYLSLADVKRVIITILNSETHVAILSDLLRFWDKLKGFLSRIDSKSDEERKKGDLSSKKCMKVGSIQSDLQDMIHKRFYEIAIKMYPLSELANMGPEDKLIRKIAIRVGLKYEREQIDELKTLTYENSILSKWATKIAEEFLFSSTPSKYLVKDPDTLEVCLGTALNLRKYYNVDISYNVAEEKIVESPIPVQDTTNISSINSDEKAINNDTLLRSFLNLSADAQRADYVLRALCVYGDDNNILSSLLQASARNEHGIKSQLGGTIVNNLSLNPSFPLWQYFKQDWEAINAQWGKGAFNIQHMISVVGDQSGLRGEKDVEEFLGLFEKCPCPSAQQAINRAVEWIRVKGSLFERDNAQFIA
eukprot:Tbor_TRINITY_DN5152_c0_g1::TRINITY_DN5152_c0_g1_i1::g.25695::m.25695/K08776/NPEPPS; puromycin-sensitive aminopeptidase